MKSQKAIIRVLVIWVIQALTLLILTLFLDGLMVDRIGTALAAVFVITLLNAVIWPLLSYILLPFVVVTFGLLAFVLNAIFVWLAGQFVDGFQVADFATAAWTSVWLTAANMITSSILTIDDDGFWYRNLVRQRMKKREHYVETDVPGVIFLEIDGLAKPLVEKAIDGGYLPNLEKWISSGSHKLVQWETDLSSQTSASQAGILHGNNHNIPAFRWFDRQKKEIISSSGPASVAELEKKLSNGEGLLANGGASRGNLFSGDADFVMNTASTITDVSRLKTSEFYAYFLHPYNFVRTLLLFVWDIITEIREFRKARRTGAYPISDKAKRGGIYPILRAFTAVLMLDLNIYTLIGDIFAGIPAAYATFVGYDEVAHHSGVESEDAYRVLKKIDRQFGRLVKLAEQAPRPYHFVVLSDHGQTQGATFKQRYHITLEEYLQQLATEKYDVQGAIDVHEDWKHLNVFLTETINKEGVIQKPVRQVLRRHTEDDEVALGPEAEIEQGTDSEFGHLVALASGNLGLVYSTRSDQRAPLEVIERIYPGMLEGLVAHEGIGFVMVNSEEQGPVAIGAHGRFYLDTGRLEGQNPLAEFGPNIVHHLKRTNAFVDAPDILVNSFFDPTKREGAAFEELIGFHGGLGGYQTQPFLLYPVEWELKDKNLIGAEAVYQFLKGQLLKIQNDPHRT
jgi:uncharacterized membrane protein YvlD (DUF360 family)